MATTGTDTRLEDLVAESHRISLGTRIDAPHRIESGRAPAGEAAPPAAEEARRAELCEGPATEQLRTQAAQLAELLRARQKELDRREAHLNAQAAQLDRDERAAKLWLSERMAELEERSHLPPPPAATAQTADAGFDAQRCELAERERLLGEELDAIKSLAAALERDRQAFQESQQAERERLDQQRALMLSELESERAALARRSEQLDHSKTALDEVREELQRVHGETLEIRLATEELWAEISGDSPPASLVRSLGRIRTQLAEHYRLAGEKLLAEREELETFRNELRDLTQQLAERKQQFDLWAIGCRREAEEQANRLIARQSELERSEAALRAESRQWQIERLEQQQEIRRLRVQLAAVAEGGIRS
jgi:hypothetical protein